MKSSRRNDALIRPAHSWRVTPRHAIMAGALCWMLFALIAALVQRGALTPFDLAGLKMWRHAGDFGWTGSPASLAAVRDLTALGGATLRTLFSLAVLMALLLLRLRREAALMLLTLLTGLAVELAMKALFGRPRPLIVPHLDTVGGMSFPSGHSFNSALGFIAAALALAPLSRRRSVRWTLIAGAMVISMLVAFSRVLLGVHYPSDVIAGWLGGAGWAFTAAALLYPPTKAIERVAAPEIEAVTPCDLP